MEFGGLGTYFSFTVAGPRAGKLEFNMLARTRPPSIAIAVVLGLG